MSGSRREAAPSNWASQSERGSLALIRAMRWIAVALGRPVARALLHPIAAYFLLFGGPATRASAAYLRRVLGRRPGWRERYRHIHRFAATVLDRVYLLREEGRGFEVEVSGADALDQVLAHGRGALLIGAHLGSFEALRALGRSRRGLRVAMCMYEHNARKINAVLQAIAPQAELRVIGLGRLESMLELRDWLQAGGVAGVLADRGLPAGMSAGRSRNVSVPFLGSPALFPDGPFRLAAMLRCPVVFMAGLYEGGARYHLQFDELADFSAVAAGPAREAAIEQALRHYAAVLERQCRRSPYNWFNFYDFWAGARDAKPVAAAQPHEPPTSHARF
ncbi:LpxL/LpxP family acyltransferase [Ramlibacter aurantiacus]|uniref:LpxL/LpxP family acyltransferase n=1 Tax=Ramlibacter aurantiacus TaxID=2801330 RepID=UPI00338EDA44